MELPQNLIKQFVSAVESKEKSSESSVSYGYVKITGDGTFVQLDGSEELTPVSVSMDVRDSDRVIVTIDNHRAFITGNLTSPASGRTASEMSDSNKWVTLNGADMADMLSMVQGWAQGAISKETKINGGWIDTDTITASQIFVKTLQEICAVIGGFSIGNSALFNGTKSMTDTTPGIYVGTDGIRAYADATHYVNIKNGIIDAYGVNLHGDMYLDSTLYMKYGSEDYYGKVLDVCLKDYGYRAVMDILLEVPDIIIYDMYVDHDAYFRGSSGLTATIVKSTGLVYVNNNPSLNDNGDPVIYTLGSTDHRQTRYINTNAQNGTNAYYISVNGYWETDSYATHNITSASSDIRLKDHIEDTKVDDAMNIINRIRLREFDWKQTGSHQDIGFIADELEKINPHLAFGGGENEDGSLNVKTVDTFYLQGLEIKAIQELSAELEAEKKKNRELEERLRKLESAVFN